MKLHTRASAAALAALISAMLSLVGGEALAAGSLAIDSLQGEKYGFSFNHPSSDQADQRSMRECGTDCTVVLRFAGECAAYSADQAKGSNAYGWGAAATGPQAQQRSMAECRERGGSSCKVRSWGCDARPATQSAGAGSKEAAASAGAARALKNDAPKAGFPMLGEWLVDYVSGQGYTANGSLSVGENLGDGRFRGVLILNYSRAGQAYSVQQQASITIEGGSVKVDGSDPVLLVGPGKYSPDSYSLTIGSKNLMRGSNTDARGATGVVVISRQ